MDDTIRFRTAERADTPLILRFIRELAAYENLLDRVVADESTLEEWLFDRQKAEVIFALAEGKEVGFALFFHNFSTFLGRAGLYLEDLYVCPEYRGRGYGKALLQRLAAIAVERGCGRLEWWCLDWNRPSIDFYRSLGAEPMSDWTVYRIAGDTLTRLAEILTEKSRAYGHNIFLVSDEPYRDIAFDGRAVPYPAAFYPHTLTCFSFSKSLSLPGERLGYVAVRPGCEGEEVLVDMMAQISRFTGHNCPPSIIQRAVSRCLDVTSDLSVYETNMNLLYNKLKELGFEVERPGGTFYLFPKALEEDANAFCRRAREFDLLLVPSDTFGVTGYVRLAYCIDTEKVKRSLPALEKLAAAYR